MSAVRVVAHSAPAAGFALAGLPVTEVTARRDVDAVLAPLLDRPDVGVILVEQELLDTMSEPVRREVMRRPSPIIVPFPGPSWGERASPAEAYVLELLRRAIGYRVRLR
jgi:vacuolar-type H+-ATPase subunit F/Vma7